MGPEHDQGYCFGVEGLQDILPVGQCALASNRALGPLLLRDVVGVLRPRQV